jgi:hypothetical protein
MRALSTLAVVLLSTGLASSPASLFGGPSGSGGSGPDGPTAQAPPSSRAGTLLERFPTPTGYTRVSAGAGSFGSWLRRLPLRPPGSPVLAFDGRRIDAPAAAVIDLDVGASDLQQCADTALRLHAEWLRAAGRTDELAYHFTSGHRSAWNDWLAGERFAVAGSQVERRWGPGRTDSPASWRSWLDLVFNYAGTRSLARDSRGIPEDAPLQPGDVFVEAGSPGHAIVILDVARGPGGHALALLGQGFMPAQDAHVLQADDTLDGAWFPLPEAGGSLQTPAWSPLPRSLAVRLHGVRDEP